MTRGGSGCGSRGPKHSTTTAVRSLHESTVIAGYPTEGHGKQTVGWQEIQQTWPKTEGVGWRRGYDRAVPGCPAAMDGQDVLEGREGAEEEATAMVDT